MSTVTIAIIVVSLIAAAIYVAGFVRGVHNAFNGYQQRTSEDSGPVPQKGYWISIAIALAFSVVSIAGMGYSAIFIYLSLFSVIVATFGVGAAFFIEKKISRSTL